MARRSVRCSCGADFPIPEVPPSILHCPRCGEPVRFASADGGAMKVREDIREPIQPLPPRNPYYPLYLLGGAGLLLAGGLITLIIVFAGREVKRNPALAEDVRPKPRIRIEEPIISIKEVPVLPSVPKRPGSEPFVLPPADPQFDTAEALARAQRLAARMNLSGIVSTLFLITNRQAEHRELHQTIAKDETELRQLALRLADRPEIHTLKEYFQAGDILTGFADATLNMANPKPFADSLRDWLATAQPGVTALAAIQREGRSILLPMWFPEIPADIVSRDLRSGSLPAAGPAAFPKEILQDVRGRMAALLPYYRKMLPREDAARLDALLKEPRGSAEDLDFLRNRILSYCARSETELASFEAKVAVLENAVASIQRLDTVTYKDGRKVQGQLEEETAEFVRLKGRFGAVRVPKADVLKVERGDAYGTEYRRRYDAARGKPAELAALLAWCKDKDIPQHRELTAYAILSGDPGNDAAWSALGVGDRNLPVAGPEFDVVILKDGSRREGVITDESDSALQIDVVVRGAKTETIGTGKATISKADISKIERMSDAARKRAKDRTMSFGDRVQKLREAQARVILSPDTVNGVPGHRSTGTLFELHSTCPPAQVRETAVTLEEMFNAYRRHFSVRRNASRRIDVYFLANAAEYAGFQRAMRGSAVSNPAYFDTQANHIVAFYGVQSDEEARVRSIILGSEREIEQYKKQITAEEDRVVKEFRTLRQQMLDEMARARKAAGEDGGALSSVDRRRTEGLNVIRVQERTALDQLAKHRSRANQAIAEHETVIRHNQAVLLSQTRAMYEILFHESFHAFAANFLWEEADNAGLPRWLHEGMASYFERSVVEAGELVHGGAHPGFLGLLRNQQRDNLLYSVSAIVGAGAELFQIRHDGDIPRQETAYAHAWGLAHYLISRGVTREQVEVYVADVSAGRNRLTAFEKLAGRRIPEVEAEWRVHLGTLK